MDIIVNWEDGTRFYLNRWRHFTLEFFIWIYILQVKIKMELTTLRLACEMEDANFEDLLLKDNSWNVHENNMHMLYKSINTFSPQIMKDFFDLKNTWYDLRSKPLLKLPETNTSRYGAQTLCFKGSLIWNTVPKNLNALTILLILRNTLKTGNLLPAVGNCVCNYSIL